MVFLSSVRVVLDQADISRAVRRLAHEIVENSRGSDDLIILGIPTRGVPLARRIAETVAQIEGHPVPCGSIDVTLYRDDLRLREVRALEPTDIPAQGIDGCTVVLVDDVLYSGRTIRAALDALHDLGRPAIVRLAVMIDRGHRELPIRPDFIGKNLPTAKDETVRVRFVEIDGVDDVMIDSDSVGDVDAG